MKMYPFSCGSYVIDRGILDNASWGEPYEHPIPMFAFRHPRGVVLFDTGHNHRGLADPRKWYGKSVDGFLEIRVTEEDCLPRQLARAGIDPSEVTHVVLSHLHIDHAGEMTSFPDAQFLVRASELPFAWWSAPNQRNSYIFNDLKDTREYNYLELPDDADFDLFGDGSLVCIHTPGHTPGHQSFLVRLPGHEKRIALCGDACYGPSNLGGALPNSGVLVDVPRWYRSIQRLRHLENCGCELWFGHDMEDWRAKTEKAMNRK
ncbi:MAG: N-acyl homoserine lactonase family protein [Planctomycetota bacterium]|nr:N-acyl homoserine lactonase family protein [Planctomycetota bacterium]